MQRKHVFRPTTPDPLEERLVLSGRLVAGLEALKGLATNASAQTQVAQSATPPAPTVDSMGDTTYYLNFGGLTRSYLVHVPAGYNGTSPLPVVLAFHGGSANAQALRTTSGFDQVSDQNGFLVVYPNGTGVTKHLYWDAGVTQKVYPATHHVDDVGFVNALLDALPQTYNVDTSRVYATGMSNGAMLTYLLGQQLSNRIAAIAPVAGSLSMTTTPSRPVPVLDFQGLKDNFVKFNGGTGPVLGVQDPPVPQVISAWASVDKDSTSPTQVITGPGYVLQKYEPAQGTSGAPVELYELPQGGHTWPGGVNQTAGLGTGRLIHSVHASELIWQFFKQFTLSNS